ncbi:hypothetical protein Tco_0319722 [Tanacetum coccineum]
MYGKIWYDEDVHDLKSVETEFPAIVFNDELSSEKTLSCEPTVSSLNNNEIDFRISFDESDDEDYTEVAEANVRFLNYAQNRKLVSKIEYGVLDIDLPPRDQRHQYLRFEGLQYIDAYIADFADFEMRDADGAQVSQYGVFQFMDMAYWSPVQFDLAAKKSTKLVKYQSSGILLIMEYLVKISKKARILELKRRHLKITILTSNTSYPSRKIWHICAYTLPKTIREQGSIRHIQRSLYVVFKLWGVTKAPTKGSKTGKSASEKEPGEEPIAEVIMDDAGDDLVCDDDQPQAASKPRLQRL